MYGEYSDGCTWRREEGGTFGHDTSSMDTNGLNRCAEAIFAAEMEGGRWVVDVMGAHTLNGNTYEQRSTELPLSLTGNPIMYRLCCLSDTVVNWLRGL